jgi:hypothetical protein
MAVSPCGAASNNPQFAGHHERGEITTQIQKAKKRMKRKSYRTEENEPAPIGDFYLDRIARV